MAQTGKSKCSKCGMDAEAGNCTGCQKPVNRCECPPKKTK